MVSFQSCRICLKPTDVKNLKLIFGNKGKIGNQIYLVSGVQIIDMICLKDPAKICEKCLQYLDIAVKFRDLCKKSDVVFRKITNDLEEKSWSKNLLALQLDSSSNDVILLQNPILETDIKCEILESPENEEYEYVAYEVDDHPFEAIDFLEETNCQMENKEESPVKEELKCKICGKVKSTLNLLKLHLYRHRCKDPKFNNGFDFKCIKCEKQFYSIKNLEIHMSLYHERREKSSYTCDYCGECYFNRAKFKTHLMEELKNMRHFECTKCGKEFLYLHHLKRHETLHAGWDQPNTNAKEKINELQCRICKGFCKNQYDVRKHLRHHKIAGEIKKPKISLKCKFCGWVCPTEDAIRQHYYNHRKANQEHNIFCQRCDESFFSYNALKWHMSRSHKIKGKKFFCDHCDKSFKNRAPMTKHLKEKHFAKKRIKAKDQKPEQMPCSYCGKILLSLPGLKNHEANHFRTKLVHFYCDLCGNRYLTKTNLQSHIKFNHIENRRFYCEDCPGKSWINNCALRKHIASCHEKVRHVCTICGKIYQHLQNLKYHYNYHYAHIEGSRRSQLKPNMKKKKKDKKKKS